MEKKVTLQQIADQLGTSKVTVSRALNHKPGMSDALRKSILECAKANGLLVKTDSPITAEAFAFLVPQRFFLEFDRFYTVIYFHLNHICQAQDITLTSIVISQEEEEKGQLPAQVLGNGYDGIFFAGECSTALLQAVTELNVPMVFIDFNRQGTNGGHILADNYCLSYDLTRYLIKRGHRRIGFVGDYLSNQNICDRYMGYLKALLFYGLVHDPEADIVNNDKNTGLYTMDFAMPREMPTAFVCACDMAAFYLYEKLKMMGLRIPEDVSVVSFDNTEICENMMPRLTSMEINKKDFAALAFRQMNNQLNGSLVSNERLFVASQLFERDSVRHFK